MKKVHIIIKFIQNKSMINLIVIVILILGGLNWGSVGFLQYDYIAGFFGTQSSIFSRLIYIIVGVATLYFVFMIFKYKGNVKIIDRKKKDTPKYIYEEDKQNTDILN